LSRSTNVPLNPSGPPPPYKERSRLLRISVS
jgi:hypothetical protein